MNDIVKKKFNAAALPDDLADQLMAGIDQSRASTILAGGGKPFLRLIKSGDWVYGADSVEVQPGSHWAINPASLGHGYSCWVEGEGNQKNTLRGEVMVPMNAPKPAMPPPIDNTPYAEQRSMDLICMDGDDEGVEVLYKTGSVGGLKAFDGLLAEIRRQLRDNRAYPCAVITLDVDSYPHPKWGKTFIPVFTITGWVDMNGRYENDAAVADDAPVEIEAAKAKRAPKEAAPAAEVTPAAAVGQRRRPAVR